MHVARRRRLGRVAVGVGVEPDRARRARARARARRRPRARANGRRRARAAARRPAARGSTWPAISPQTARIWSRYLARSSPSSSASIGILGDGAEVVHAEAELGEPPDAAPRSGSPTAPCRRRGGPARGRARRRGRRPCGSGAHARPRSSEQRARARRRAPPGRPARRRAARPPPAAADDPARLAHEQVARGVIPLGEPVLVEGVQAARRDPGQVERGRAGAADVARPRQHARERAPSAAARSAAT